MNVGSIRISDDSRNLEVNNNNAAQVPSRHITGSFETLRARTEN